MILDRNINIDGIIIKLKPKEGSCKLDNVIYIASCNICNDFYIGHTIDILRIRCTGHRSNFKEGSYQKSALSYHIFNDHFGHLAVGLNNFSFGVIAQCDPLSIIDLENRYIIQFKADTLHLNRYKAMRFQD